MYDSPIASRQFTRQKARAKESGGIEDASFRDEQENDRKLPKQDTHHHEGDTSTSITF